MVPVLIFARENEAELVLHTEVTEYQLSRLPEPEQKRLTTVAHEGVQMAGAHYVVDSIADVGPLLDEINRRLAAGERP